MRTTTGAPDGPADGAPGAPGADGLRDADGVHDAADADAGRVKDAIRARLRAERRARYAGETGATRRAREADALTENARPLLAHLARHASAPGGAAVAVFRSTRLEPDLLPLLRELWAVPGLRVLFPAEQAGSAELDWVLAAADAAFPDGATPGFGAAPLGKGLGPHALATVDLVLAPALAVGTDGTRLGHGGGYYDRALTHLRAGTPVVAVVHGHELLDPGDVPREPHDLGVDGVLTPVGLHRVPGGMLPLGDGGSTHAS